MITVYTTIFGDATRDRLRPPPAGCHARYVCFTDCQIPADGWELRPVWLGGRSPLFLARLYKTRPDRWFGPEAVTIWTDASCQLLQPAEALWAAADAPVMGFLHPDRPSVQAEAQQVMKLRLAPDGAVQQQMTGYADAGFDILGATVTTTGVLLRGPAAHRFNTAWEDQIVRFNVRDQLSIDYCGWSTRTHIGRWPGHYRANLFMRYHQHPRLKAAS